MKCEAYKVFSLLGLGLIPLVGATIGGVIILLVTLFTDFPNATIMPDDGTISAWAEGALTAIEHPAQTPELPINVRGTAFQEAVWRELTRIPPGESLSYAALAARAGKPGAARAAVRGGDVSC